MNRVRLVYVYGQLIDSEKELMGIFDSRPAAIAFIRSQLSAWKQRAEGVSVVSIEVHVVTSSGLTDEQFSADSIRKPIAREATAWKTRWVDEVDRSYDSILEDRIGLTWKT